MASIRDVAKLANVSPATVSRVMNGTANVDSEKKERVLAAISETGFVPNAVARSLFKKSARTIGLIVPSIENPFFTHMAHAIEKTADEYGYRLLLCNTGSDIEKEKEMIQMLTSMNADGIILTSSNEEMQPIVENCPIPIVVTDRQLRRVTNCDYVHCDHYQGGRMAMEHMVECGCQNIVCVIGPQHTSSARARYEGYADVCKEQGIKEQVLECNYDFYDGLRAAEEMLNQYPNVDGVVACNDMVAISIFKVLSKHGIRVPEQVQIIGFDNVQLASLVTPELTTIAQPIEEMGKKAAELLIHRSDETKEKAEYVFEAKLIKRNTTRMI